MTDPKALQPILTLLLDGMDDKQIAAQIADQFGSDRAQRLVYALADATGCSIHMSLCPLDILEHLPEDDSGFGDPNGWKFVGTPEELKAAVENAEWGDSGELFALTRDEVIDGLKSAGLVVVAPVEVTP